MVGRAVACFRVVLYGWMGVLIAQAAGSSIGSGPLVPLSPADSFSSARETSLEALKWNPFLPGGASRTAAQKSAPSSLDSEWILRGTLTAGVKGAAVLERKTTGEQRWVYEGERLEALTLVKVGRRTAHFKSPRGERRLVARADWENGEGLAGIVEKVVEPAKPAVTLEETEIQQIGDDEFVVKTGMLRKLAEQIPQMIESLGFILTDMESGRAAYLVDGEETGMEWVEHLGIRDGDLIKSINGKPMRSDQELISIFSNLGKEKEIQVEVDRDEEMRVLTYHVQP